MPALAMAILLLCGVGVGLAASGLSGDAALCAAAAAIMVGCAVRRAAKVRDATLIVAFFAAGVSLGQVTLGRCARNDVARLAGERPVLARVRVAGFEDVRPRGVFSEGMLATVRVLAVNGEAASGSVRLRVDRADASIIRGGTWEMLGMLTCAAAPRVEGESDGAWADRAAGVGAELRVEGTAQARRIEPPGVSPLAWWRGVVRRKLAQGTAGTVNDALLRSLLLGDPDPRLGGVRDDFQRTGTSHHLAVSGTHLAFLGGTVLAALRAMSMTRHGARLTPRRSAAVAFGVVLAYSLAVAPSAALVRSVLLAGLAAIGLALGRRISTANLLGVCAVAMVAADPGVAFGAGFQLTFFVLLAIVIVAPAAHAHLREYQDRDFAVADAWVPDSPGARRRRLKWRWIRGAATAVVAFLAAAPLVGHHFSQLNPYTAVAGLLLEPFAFLAILAGVAKVALTAICPWAAGWLAVPAGGVGGLLRWAVHLLGAIPGTSIGARALPALVAVPAAVALFLPLLVRSRRAYRTAAWAAVLVLLPALPLLAALARPGANGLHVTLLAERQGSTFVIEAPGCRPLLIDPTSDEQVQRRLAEPFFVARGLSKFGTVIFARPSRPAEVAKQMLGSRCAGATFLGDAAHPFEAGASLREGDVYLDVLYPPADSGHAGGRVIRIGYRGRTLLVVEDLGDAAIADLSRRPWDLRADVVFHRSTSRFRAATTRLLALAHAGRTFDMAAVARGPALEMEISPEGTLTVSR